MIRGAAQAYEDLLIALWKSLVPPSHSDAMLQHCLLLHFARYHQNLTGLRWTCTILCYNYHGTIHVELAKLNASDEYKLNIVADLPFVEYCC